MSTLDNSDLRSCTGIMNSKYKSQPMQDIDDIIIVKSYCILLQLHESNAPGRNKVD